MYDVTEANAVKRMQRTSLRLLKYLPCMFLHFCVDFEYSAIVTDSKSEDEEAEDVENGDKPVFVSLLLDEKIVNVVDGKD